MTTQKKFGLGNTDVLLLAHTFYACVGWTTLHLYAKPDAVYPITVRAYQQPCLHLVVQHITDPIDLATSGFTCSVWLTLLLARVYQRQEDPELSAMYLKSFEEGVAMARRDLMKTPSARPLIVVGW
jgi:hypothetical protein